MYVEVDVGPLRLAAEVPLAATLSAWLSDLRDSRELREQGTAYYYAQCPNCQAGAHALTTVQGASEELHACLKCSASFPRMVT